MPSPHLTDIAIALHEVGFAYGGETVLEDITVSVKEGDYVGLIGPNGGGKTTLLRIILGLLEPAEGIVRIFGHSVVKAREHIEIGYVPQHVAALDASFPATVAEIVRSGRTSRRGLFHRWNNSDVEMVKKAMEQSGIWGLKDKRIGQLSGGQRQRVLIARALAAEPKILILDEPTVGVDAGAMHEFYTLLAMLNKKEHMTIVIVSHDIDGVAREVTTVLCLNKRLVCHVPIQEFKKETFISDVYHGHTKPVPHVHEPSPS